MEVDLDADLDALAEEYKADPYPREIYLMQRFISAVMGMLRGARIDAGMTQADAAERVGTTQSVIARMERDSSGMTSLRRLVAYAVAVGIDLDIDLQPIRAAAKVANPANGNVRTEE